MLKEIKQASYHMCNPFLKGEGIKSAEIHSQICDFYEEKAISKYGEGMTF